MVRAPARPANLAFAVVLACFPAGLAVGADVLSNVRSFVCDGLRLTGAALALAAVTFAMIQFVAPAALASGGSTGTSVEPREPTLPALRAYARAAVERAEAGPRTDLEAWRVAQSQLRDTLCAD